MLERLQKIISAAGVTSRRAAEEMIREGRVRVNGQVVTELGTKADADHDHIKVDGKLINPKQPPTYVMLNKPAGYVTTMADPEGRPTVQDLLKGIKVRVYPVGRLDYSTEGMLILTNDGDFAHLITHPKHELPKTYLAKIKGVLDEKQIESLESGVYLDDGKTAPARLKKIRKEEANSWVEITITEGRKRQVRRMFDRVGRSVIKLKRIRTGALVLGDLPEGKFRHMTGEEVAALKEMAQRTEVRGQRPESRGLRSDVRQRGAEIRGAASHTTGDKRMLDMRGPKPAQVADLRRNQERHAVRNDEVSHAAEVKREAAARGPKPSHRGPKPDLRPWRLAETKSDDRSETRTRGRRTEYKSPGTDYKRPRRASGGYGKPGDRGSRPERPASGTDYKRPRPASGGYGKPGARGSRPERSASGADYKRPRPAFGGYVKAADRVQGTDYTASGTGFKRRRPASGGQARSGSWAPRQASGVGMSSDARNARPYRDGKPEGRRPSTGPRPNSSSRPAGNVPGRGTKFVSKGPGRGPGARPKFGGKRPGRRG